MSAYLADYDPVRLDKIYNETEIGYGLYAYKCKRENDNKKTSDNITLQYKLAFMQMDWIAKCFTGTNPELSKSYESKIKEVELPADNKPKARTQKDEDNMLAAFESAGIKVKNKT
jgi:hypothetical protein